MTDNTVKALGRAYGIMAAQLPDIIGAHCREVDRAIRDALQGAEDITEDEHALPLNQQGMWELAYMQGRCAPVLGDGEYLRDQLKARGLTLEQAAEACEVSKAAVHSWCAGIKPIPQARRELLAAKFGIII